MKAVLDTNVIISALGWQGRPQDIFNAFIDGKFDLVITPSILNEIDTVLKRSKFDFIPQAQKDELLLLLSELAEIVIPVEKINACRDKNDNKFLEAAVKSSAEFIVSGDNDLLEMKEFRGTKIVSVDEFCKLLQK